MAPAPPAPSAAGPAGGRAYDLILAAFVAVLLISNVASTKILRLGPFTFDGGTILFPVSYIFGDILTEDYGYRRSRRVIWTGFGCLAVSALVLVLRFARKEGATTLACTPSLRSQAARAAEHLLYAPGEVEDSELPRSVLCGWRCKCRRGTSLRSCG